MRSKMAAMIRTLSQSMHTAVTSASNRSAGRMPISAPAVPRAVPRPCSVFSQPRSRTALRPSAAQPLCGAWPAAAAQQKAAFRHIAVCAATATADAPAETFQYQAEVDRLMDMIVNSLYSNRDVFLRELISNASDALDKIRFISIEDDSALKGNKDLEIRVKADPDARTITIEDTGVGMTRDDMLSSLGTIARSGTRKFAEAMAQGGDSNLIGQFGVGFYSSFLVADRVVVQSRSYADDTQWRWESSAGSHEFKLAEDTSGDALERGTRVTLHLKDDAAEYAGDKKLGELIKQYSEFIAFPIKLWAEKSDTEKVVDEEKTAEKQRQADEEAKEAGKEGGAEPVESVYKYEPKTTVDWAVQNDNKPLWTRSPKEVEKAEYDEFFKLTFKEFLDPLAVAHFNVEGTLEFRAMLFVPGMAPFDQQDFQAKSRSIRLYVKRVFISDEFDDSLMPRYLSFVKGIVDSSDLPLNVSREILQESRIVRVMRKQLVKRSLDMIKDISKRPAGESGRSDYDTFWEAFGRNLKLGVIEDAGSRDQLAPLLRFPTSKSGEDMTGLDDYVSRMKDGQTSIFYMAADSRAAAESAPFVEQLVRRDYEVVYLTEPIDEVTIQNMAKYGEHAFVDVSKEEIDLGEDEDEKAKKEEAEKELAPLAEAMKAALGDRVERVVVSRRLADSPVALVTSKFGWSANMERIMKTQAMGDNRAMEYMRGRRILEINPDSPVISALRARLESDPAGVAPTTELLYETALITGGFTVDSPKEFANRIYSLLAGDTPAASSSSSSSGQRSASSGAGKKAPDPEVTPEVLAGNGDNDGSDPWR